MRATPRHYYDSNPASNHATGDIWANLPSHGLLREAFVSGLVITPACDLAQSKVETITYLPILEVSEWFRNTAFRADLLVALRAEAELLGLSGGRLLARDATPTLQEEDLLFLDEQIRSVSPQKERSRTAKERCEAGAKLLRASLLHRTDKNELLRLTKQLLGQKNWQQLVRHVITNHRKDIHFLPKDGLAPEWSTIREHSVVLFRYPLTAPVEIFDAAQDVSLRDWSTWTRQVQSHIALARSFEEKRPIKGLCLRKDFLSDLLTRYAGLFLRIGSPDFSPDGIDSLAAEMEPA